MEQSVPVLFGNSIRDSLRVDFECLYTSDVTRHIILQLQKCQKLGATTQVALVQDDVRTWVLRMCDFENAPGTIYALLFFPCTFPHKAPCLRVLSPTGIWTHSKTRDSKPWAGETRSICIEGFTMHGSATTWQTNWVTVFKKSMANWIRQLRMTIEYPNTVERHHGTGWIKAVLDGTPPQRPPRKTVDEHNTTNPLIQKLQTESFSDDDADADADADGTAAASGSSAAASGSSIVTNGSSAATRIPCCFTYVVSYLEGLSPSVLGDMLTNAVCKPEIRRGAHVGDIVIGYKGMGLHKLMLSKKAKKLDDSYELEMLFWYRITEKMLALQYTTTNFGSGRRPDQNYTETGQHVLLHEFHLTDEDRKSDLLQKNSDEASVLLSTDYMCFAHMDGQGALRGAPKAVTDQCCPALTVRTGQRGHNMRPTDGFKTLENANKALAALRGLAPHRSTHMQTMTEQMQTRMERLESRETFVANVNRMPTQAALFSPDTFYLLPTEAELRSRYPAENKYQLFRTRCETLYKRLTSMQKRSVFQYWYKLMCIGGKNVDAEYAAFFNVLLSIGNARLSWRQQQHSLRTIEDVVAMAHESIAHEKHSQKERPPSSSLRLKSLPRPPLTPSTLTKTFPKRFYAKPDAVQRTQKRLQRAQHAATQKKLSMYVEKIAANSLSTRLYVQQLHALPVTFTPPESILQKLKTLRHSSSSNINTLLHKWEKLPSEDDDVTTSPPPPTYFLQIEKSWYDEKK
jgi:hypothetical protein